MIPRLLPSEVVVGEHFVNADLLHLISSGASTSGGVEIEIADRRSVARSPSRSFASISGGSGSAQPSLRRSKGGGPPERLPLPSREDFPSNDVIINYEYGCCAFAHNIFGSEPLILIGMPDTSTPPTLEFFVNPRCPLISSSVFPVVEPVEIFEENLSAKDLPVAKGGVDIPSGSPAILDKEPNVVAGARARNYHLLVEHAFFARHFILCFCILTF